MKRLNAQRLVAAVGGKALVIPKEGWRASTFRLHGLAMVRAMHRAALITQKQQQGSIVRGASQAFTKQIEEVIRRFLRASNFGRTSAYAYGVKVSGDIFLSAHEDLVLSILNEVLQETGAEVTAEILPGIRSTLDQGYSKSSILLAQEPKVRDNPNLQRRARTLAARITNISDTTRKRFKTVLTRAVKERLSVPQAVKLIREKLPQIQANRALTIARTELNQAWTDGAVQAFQESKTLTFVSVIGCESREEDRWDSPSYAPYLYRGESTCNIVDVPVADADKLEFHINHTGTMVPSGFIE